MGSCRHPNSAAQHLKARDQFIGRTAEQCRRRHRRTGQWHRPGVTTFFRLLNQVDEATWETALLAWQDQVLGPVHDRLIAVDGKQLRHSQGGELVSAVAAQSGRGLGTVRPPDKTHEIPTARALLDRVQQRIDLSGNVVVLDALHTQDDTARQIVQPLGAAYLLTVKENQKGLHQTVRGLLSARAFSPSGPSYEGATQATESRPTGTAPTAPATDDARTSRLCGDRPEPTVANLHAGERPLATQELGAQHQCGSAALECRMDAPHHCHAAC